MVVPCSRLNFYKDKNDQWQRTSQLDADDLLPGALALQEAYRWIDQHEAGILSRVA